MSRRAVVIALDAAEPALVRMLIDRGRMPNLARLLEKGSWSDVTSPADIGSGAVWPAFVTGLSAAEHGIHSEWSWDAESMSLWRTPVAGLVPFWMALADSKRSIGIVDVPFAPFLGLANGFELAEWGAHDRIEGRTQISAGLELPPHPFSSDDEFAAGAAQLAAHCRDGARLRGRVVADLLSRHPCDLAIVAFTEIHHASHALWDTLSAGHRAAGAESADTFVDLDDGSPLVELFRVVDEQIGEIARAGGDAALVVLSLHGMRATTGRPELLEHFLVEAGYARGADFKSQTMRQRAISLLATAKRLAPASVKRLYYRTLPPSATARLAQPTMLPSYDWSQTRAFSLPSDQHGWIRINLRSREAKGIVDASDYIAFREELRSRLLAMTDAEGAPLVAEVIATAVDPGSARTLRLPDLVVHWTAAAERPPYASRSTRKLQTGQHAPRGFAIAQGLTLPPSVDATDFSRILGSR